jgi:hypothetical protein
MYIYICSYVFDLIGAEVAVILFIYLISKIGQLVIDMYIYTCICIHIYVYVYI